MFEKIFEEIFGDNAFDKLFEEAFNEKTENGEVSNDKDTSYYHSIKDKYKNGKHVSHLEKEVKDGKVLKDVNKTYDTKIENKPCEDKECKCNKDICDCEIKEEAPDIRENIDPYIEKKYLNGLVEKLHKAIISKDAEIELYSKCLKSSEKELIEKDKKISVLENRLEKVKNVLGV